MSTITYNPNHAWPIPVLAKFTEIREKIGFHLIYKNGFRRNNDYEHHLFRLGGIGHHRTLRVFALRVDMEQICAMHIIYDDNYYGKVEIPGGEAGIVSKQRGYDKAQHDVLVPNVDIGEVFSFGMRIIYTDSRRFHYLQGVANDAEGQWMNVGYIDPKTYKFKIWQRNHIFLSMHITCEECVLGEDRTGHPFYLPEYFDIPESEQPPGSSMIARLQLKDPNSDLNIGVDPGTGTKYHNYGKRQDLSADSPFTVYIRNLPDRYVMVTSFDPQLITTQHNNRGKRNIWFHRGDNSVTLNLTHYILWDK